MGAKQARQQFAILQGELGKVFEAPLQPALVTPLHVPKGELGKEEQSKSANRVYGPGRPKHGAGNGNGDEFGSPRGGEENRGSQSNERDLGHREETGCRGWEAWCSGRNLKTNETARGRTRVHSNETAKERTRELFERNRQGEDSSTSSRKKC